MLADKCKKIIQDMSAENYKPLQKVPEELKKPRLKVAEKGFSP